MGRLESRLSDAEKARLEAWLCPLTDARLAEETGLDILLSVADEAIFEI